MLKEGAGSSFPWLQARWRLASNVLNVGRNSAVGIATGYGLEGLGIESMPIPVAERSKARVCGRSLAGIADSNPTRGMDVCVVL